MTYPTDPASPTGPGGPKPAPSGGWIKVVLFVSLALNLAVAGLAIGAALRHDDLRDRVGARADHLGGPYTGALSREDRRAIWREMRAMQAEGRPMRGDIRADFDAVVQALRAEPYDPSAVRDIVERQFQAGLERQKIGQDLLLQRIAGMDAAARAAFADRLEERLERRDNWREQRRNAREEAPRN
ncbi:MAG: periplasmic heavy metal sensor [Rhodobacterales bacterium]|nr:periplasmic heavy metal sensor [Rhodobacterales bacterium]MDX5390949.1 periplasmic heavy metal sensor [Rhodobacterales bacterium]MDX5490644.1 periplasmic heavy metal sensor [Rhodobacterales bacterium]